MSDPRAYTRFILENCIRCGSCVRVCPSIDIAGIDDIDPQLVQQSLYNFLEDFRPDDIVSKRIDSCLACFRCVGSCPVDINPLMFINEAKDQARRNQLPPYDLVEPSPFESHYRSLEQDLTDDERQIVTTAPGNSGSKYLFFPGCNIYKDSQRLIKVLSLIEQCDEDVAFLPGLSNCCGDRFSFNGDLHNAGVSFENLANAVNDLQPETLILWCPTCLVHLNLTWNIPVRVISFFEFIRDHQDRLNFKEDTPEIIVTLHEPCKTAYTGLDNSHRSVLQALPNVTLREMENRVSCCGSGGITHYRDETVRQITAKRLKEAESTGADNLVTVCHYCQELFAEEREPGTIAVNNLADILFDHLDK